MSDMTDPITDERLAEALDGDLMASLIARIDVAEEKLAASEAEDSGRRTTVNKQAYIGQVTGFSGGLFGRDAHGPNRIEAFGIDWVVVRDHDGDVLFGEAENWIEFLDAEEEA